MNKRRSIINQRRNRRDSTGSYILVIPPPDVRQPASVSEHDWQNFPIPIINQPIARVPQTVALGHFCVVKPPFFGKRWIGGLLEFMTINASHWVINIR